MAPVRRGGLSYLQRRHEGRMLWCGQSLLEDRHHLYTIKPQEGLRIKPEAGKDA